jgi:UDP-2-acetamido-3-amino-2,3-dideoxy-glucuronate N-acetyltransferase
MIHETAAVDAVAFCDDLIVWDFTRVCSQVEIGPRVKIGRCVYIDNGVSIGSECKIQNLAQIYGPTRISDGVFIGPGAMLINDKNPRARGADGLKEADEWYPSSAILVKENASIGAGAIVFPGVIVGEGAMVGAGTVLRHDLGDGEVFTG